MTNSDGQTAALPAAFTYTNADVNGDGSVNAVDALCILRAVAVCPRRPTVRVWPAAH
ncbi:MAG: dockerin type I domain-containing protein [Dehalococcoidia bacterium]